MLHGPVTKIPLKNDGLKFGKMKELYNLARPPF